MIDAQGLDVFKAWFLLGCLCCVVGYGALLYSSMETPRGRRRALTLIACMAILVLLVAGVSVYADQPVLNPCSQCATAEGWLWWALMCWSC